MKDFAAHKPPAPRLSRPQPPALDFLADAHGNHAGARHLQIAYAMELEPHTDPILIARAERYYDHTPARDANWHDCLQAAITDRREGRL